MRSARCVGFFVAVCAHFGIISTALATPFTPNTLVVLQSSGTTSSAQSVSLVQFNTTGTGQTGTTIVSLNSGATGVRLTQSGSNTTEGSLSLSGDRGYLTLVGYNAQAGTANVSDTSTGTVPRVVALVDWQGNVNLTTSTTSFNQRVITSGTTQDGSRLYMTGIGPGNSEGLYSTTLGASGSASKLVGDQARVSHVFNSQLYYSNGSQIVRTTPALPTTSASDTVVVSGLTNPMGFVFLDRDASVAGVDTLYIADQTNGLLKYSFNGTTWTARGTVATGITGITGVVNGGTAELFVTTGDSATAGNELRRFVDTAAFNATISGSYTTLATAASGTVFRGVAFAPIPEPSSLVLGGMALALGGCGYVARRRRLLA